MCGNIVADGVVMGWKLICGGALVLGAEVARLSPDFGGGVDLLPLLFPMPPERMGKEW